MSPLAIRLALVLAPVALAAAGLVAVLLHCTPAPQPVAAPPPVVLPPPAKLESAASIRERKRLFIALLLPLVQEENRRLVRDRERLNRIEHELGNEDAISRDDFDWLKQMAEDYNLDPKARRNQEFFRSLRRRVDAVPAGLVIAQAAIESGWGRSQVTREANNFFGHYCYEEGCGAPAPGSGDLRVFATPADSVHAYIHNLNSHAAYRDLRRQRAELRARGQAITGRALAPALAAYSERGDAYIADVLAMIRANKLDDLPNL